jgi:hypothetical protein
VIRLFPNGGKEAEARRVGEGLVNLDPACEGSDRHFANFRTDDTRPATVRIVRVVTPPV